jgi:quercetin dioxygenase-like cupin family protein
MKRCVVFLFLSALLTAQGAPELEMTAEPHHRLVLANDRVRVFNVEIPPHAETFMHWHRHDYIYITLGRSQVVNTVKGKSPVNVEMQDGQTGFLSGGFAHMARDLSSEPYRNVTIELLRDDKVRHAPGNAAHPEEDRGLEILNGGTREILFVKDGVRVSEVELQPGGALPLHYHGPHLVVALTDCELRGDVKGKSSESIPMKRGESRWAAGGHLQTLTNNGHHAVKFITLEFR